jgi:hypothetical protein
VKVTYKRDKKSTSTPNRPDPGGWCTAAEEAWRPRGLFGGALAGLGGFVALRMRRKPAATRSCRYFRPAAGTCAFRHSRSAAEAARRSGPPVFCGAAGGDQPADLRDRELLFRAEEQRGCRPRSGGNQPRRGWAGARCVAQGDTLEQMPKDARNQEEGTGTLFLSSCFTHPSS